MIESREDSNFLFCVFKNEVGAATRNLGVKSNLTSAIMLLK